jgi:hypothetical protein
MLHLAKICIILIISIGSIASIFIVGCTDELDNDETSTSSGGFNIPSSSSGSSSSSSGGSGSSSGGCPDPEEVKAVVPELIQPVDGGYVCDNSLVFLRWTIANSEHSYDIQYSFDEDLTSIIDTLHTNSNIYPIDLSDNVYYWQVRAVDICNETSSWSEPAHFNLFTNLPIVNGLQPDGVTTPTNQPTFSWDSLDAGYDVLIEIYEDQLQGSDPIAAGQVSADSNWTPVDPLPTGTLYWKATCKKGECNGDSSEWATIDIP